MNTLALAWRDVLDDLSHVRKDEEGVRGISARDVGQSARGLAQQSGTTLCPVLTDPYRS